MPEYGHNLSGVVSWGSTPIFRKITKYLLPIINWQNLLLTNSEYFISIRNADWKLKMNATEIPKISSIQQKKQPKIDRFGLEI